MPQQLDEWKEKHDKPIYWPYNNENVTAWRDDIKAIDTPDFDP